MSAALNLHLVNWQQRVKQWRWYVTQLDHHAQQCSLQRTNFSVLTSETGMSTRRNMLRSGKKWDHQQLGPNTQDIPSLE